MSSSNNAGKMSVVSTFGLTRHQLSELMCQRGADALSAVAECSGVTGVMESVDTNTKTGLSNNSLELETRKSMFGVNYIKPIAPKSFLALCFDAIQDKTLIILIVAALVSIVLGVAVEEDKSIAWIEGVAILGAVVIVVLVTAVNDWTKEKQFRGLQKRLETDAKFSVLREGNLEELPLAEIVVGDILQFKYGNTFPVDGLLIQGYDVKVDEASLTGEAELVKKLPDRDVMLLAGTQVMEGGGRMVVTAVGPNSQQGIIFQLLTKREDDAGFIEKFFRDRVFKKCLKKPVDDEEANQVQTPGSPDHKSKEAEVEAGEMNEEDEMPPLPPLMGWDRLSISKRMKRRKEMKEREKSKKKPSEKTESGSVLQRKLNKLAIQIGYAGTIAAVVCFFILFFKFVIEDFLMPPTRAWDSSKDFSEILHFIIISITVLVVAVPEGLPLAVTISLAFSVKKMLNDNNLVRHLHACETMGNATAICSDKTGTLTTNRMTVVESFLGGTRYNVTPRLEDLPQTMVDLLKVNIAVNSSYTSQLLKDTDGGDVAEKVGFMTKLVRWFKPSNTEGLLGQGLARQVGNVTECALLGFLVDLDIDYEAIRDQFPIDNFTKVYTFNSSRKSMSTVIALPNGGYRLFTKGASEIVLAKCSSTVSQDGNVSNLSDDDRVNIVATVVTPMAENALRTIALAYRDFPPGGSAGEITSMEPEWDDEESIVNDLTLLAIVGIQDPVRPEVPGCIGSCQNAGITVRMVTGDNIDTARAIALKCGIINKGDSYLVMEGKEFNKKIRDQTGEINPDKFDRIWPHLRVLARSSPTDKHILVDGIIQSRLNKNREVVAVTGDGTNDGPALKRADVGFAMGIAGTDVAKEACDIILIDDNFASIVKAVMWGRNVYDSISKFLQFQLTVNVVAVVLALISAIAIGDTPLRAVQLLWVNLIMDTLASLALSTESPTPHLLERKPYGRNKALVSPHMWLFILGHSLYQLTVMFVLLFAGPMILDIDDGKFRELRATPGMHFTLIFNTFVFMQIFNEINARTVHGERNVFSGIFKNWIFIGVMIVQVSVQIIIAQFGSFVFNTSGLNWELWMWSIFLGSTELIVWQLLLFIPLKPLEWLLEGILPALQLRGRNQPQEHVDYEGDDPLDQETTRPAQVLWMKSLTRLRTQIRVVNAFRSGLDSGSAWSGSVAHLHSTPVPVRYNKHLAGLETAV